MWKPEKFKHDQYTCPDCGTVVANSPFLCIPMTTEIAGETWQGCVSANAATGAVAQTVNQRTCYDDGGNKTVNTTTCTSTANEFSAEPGCEVAQNPLRLCDTMADCPGAGTTYCIAASMGTCAATGACE